MYILLAQRSDVVVLDQVDGHLVVVDPRDVVEARDDDAHNQPQDESRHETSCQCPCKVRPSGESRALHALMCVCVCVRACVYTCV